MNETIRLPFSEMKDVFFRILLQCGMAKEKAETCAHIFAENSLEGVYTHGVNRFPAFVNDINNHFVLVDQEAELKHSVGALEQWEGNLGPGILNALTCTERAMNLANEHGIGCVGLANTNHWMRGGAYGWKAAKAGYAFICWTNTIANLPAWRAVDCRLGNNPIIMGVPYQQEAIVLDMAVSQYSNGKLNLYKMQNQQLPLPGGYDSNGELTMNPAEILTTERALPIGYWKGAGLSLLLDLLAVILSGGLSTREITGRKTEYGVSQIFIAFHLTKLPNYPTLSQTVNGIVNDLHQSIKIKGADPILYPGERVLLTKDENRKHGIPVLKSVWDKILNMA